MEAVRQHYKLATSGSIQSSVSGTGIDKDSGPSGTSEKNVSKISKPPKIATEGLRSLKPKGQI